MKFMLPTAAATAAVTYASSPWTFTVVRLCWALLTRDLFAIAKLFALFEIEGSSTEALQKAQKTLLQATDAELYIMSHA